MELMNLKTLCEMVGVSRRSIQCYEKAGLMGPTDKNKYGHLLYDDTALHKAKIIRFMQELGFKLREVSEIIEAPNSVIKEALKRRIEELKDESVRLEEIIKEATEYLQNLE
jgi:DNA-binding transcriptional MerR regulator